MRIEKLMLRCGVILTAMISAAGSSGCSTMNNTEKGVGLGGLLGAGLGTAVGAATGNPKTGAVVGGLAGAGIGGLVGNDMDRADQQKREDRQAAVAVANAQAQAAQRLGITDIVRMVQEGYDSQVIINQIRITNSTFPTLSTSTSDLDFLKQNNVPPAVIVEMQSRAQPQAVVVQQRPVVVREPYYYAPPPVVYAAPPPPPPGVVFVGGYRRW